MRSWWYCNACGAQNSPVDGECQFCICEGADCERSDCSDPAHFCPDTAEHETCNSRRDCRAIQSPEVQP
jgi:hypothetical protein